ncbi:PREDICTED: selenoprotein S-like [Diuraphis noxia]|uniref:selenoprotein S-like n=1 Tax=Diuraphis noxia TaxID=143948 RepID=UPI000763A26C|nr:PREDICTED: selenoprotein S-like [Diuraphis noxia]XP_015363533.1 PREDICTED: selenoprotein S-like [Diuraphis noxia]
MDMEEEIINADDEEISYFESITDYVWSFLGFVQNNGWYFLAFIILLAYLVPKLWPHYLKWLKQRAEAAYDADIKKNPDLFKQKQEELQKARIKFQEEYEKKAKIALEKQKEKEKKILEEKQALLNNGTSGQSINRSQKSKNSKPDYNPLMGSGSGSNYRPPRRSACSGGGCG